MKGVGLRYHQAIDVAEVELLVSTSSCGSVTEQNNSPALKLQRSALKMKGSPEVAKSCGEEDSDQSKNGITLEALAVLSFWNHQELIYSGKEPLSRRWLRPIQMSVALPALKKVPEPHAGFGFLCRLGPWLLLRG